MTSKSENAENKVDGSCENLHCEMNCGNYESPICFPLRQLNYYYECYFDTAFSQLFPIINNYLIDSETDALGVEHV